MSIGLDYDKMLYLDAEDLAEGGIKRAYESILPALSEHISEPAQVQELLDSERGSYLVKCGGHDYLVYDPSLPDSEGQSWGRATYVFFDIVNGQLAGSDYRLFAINGGNDLGGMLLRQSECAEAQSSLPRKEDWPYLPTSEHPWYGQHHK
jgi:hypothetical protein